MRQLLNRQCLKQASRIISAKCITINTCGGTITHKNIDAYSKILDKYLKIVALVTSWSFLDDIKVVYFNLQKSLNLIFEFSKNC